MKGSAIKSILGIGLLLVLFVGALIGLTVMSDGIDSEIENKTSYFEEENVTQSNNLEEREEDNLLETHYGSSDVTFVL